MWKLRKAIAKARQFSNSTILEPAKFQHVMNNPAPGYSTTVMSFGDGSHGALGHPDFAASAYEPRTISALPDDIVSVAAGHYHSFAVTSQGRLWSWGRNQEAQLGHGVIPRHMWSEPKAVDGLNHVHVVATFASGVVSAALGDDGSLWIWGKSKRGQLGLGEGVEEALSPSRVEALACERISKVSFGWGHSLALTEDGKLFAWGFSEDGRIGKSKVAFSAGNIKIGSKHSAMDGRNLYEENDTPIVWNPSLVEDLYGVPVVDIACGLDHSLVLCGSGEVLSAGSNEHGQLGRETQEGGFFRVNTISYPMSIAAGSAHSLVICGDPKKILSWGWNKWSQLGRMGPENIPLEVNGFVGGIPLSISGGRAHSIALMSNKRAWSWGCGKDGRLGTGGTRDEIKPTPIENLEDLDVLQAVAGLDHNLILVRGNVAPY